jgi:tetratricopeptide (TPR) repeat protein
MRFKAQRAFRNLAWCQYLRKDYENAEIGYRRALDMQGKLIDEFPNNKTYWRQAAEIQTLLSAILTARGRLDEAIEQCDEAIRIYPGYADVYAHRAVAYAHKGELDKALGDLDRAIELNPNLVGGAKYRARNWKDAIEALSKSEPLTPRGQLSFNAYFLALFHRQLGEKEEARQWYDKAVECMENEAPEHEVLRRLRAEAERLLDVGPESNQQQGEPVEDATGGQESNAASAPMSDGEYGDSKDTD